MTVGTLQKHFIAIISIITISEKFQGFSCIQDFVEIASVSYLHLINLNLDIVNILNA